MSTPLGAREREDAVATDPARSFHARAPVGNTCTCFLLLSSVKGRLFRKEDQRAFSQRSVLLKHTMLRPTASLHAFDCSGAAIECDLNAVPEFYQK